MMDEELAAIRARVDAATPGPWRCWNGYELRVPHVDQPVVPDMAMSRIGPESHLGVGLSSVRACDDMRALRPDAEFIAHAREDVPALLAEVERLRKRDAAMRAIVERVAAHSPAEYPGMLLCNFCDHYAGSIYSRDEHTPDCPVTAARALLATPEGEGEA